MSFTSDCNLRDAFSKKKSWGRGPVYMQTHAQKHTRTDTDACMDGNLLKSLSREVVTSAALFTRLMPRCTQERVNQARGYTHRPDAEPASSSSLSPPRNWNEATPCITALIEMKAGRLLDTLVHYIYTIRVRMTVVEVELKPFALQ